MQTNNPALPRTQFEDVGQVLAVLLVVVGYLLYSAATVNQMTWLLEPTVRLVSWMTGDVFHFVSGQGYVRRDGLILIHKGCSGGQFLLTAYGLAWLMLHPLPRSRTFQLLSFLLGLVGPLLLTILANTSRICSAMWALRLQLHHHLSLSKQGLHFGVGLGTYLVMFVLFFLLLQRWNHVVRRS